MFDFLKLGIMKKGVLTKEYPEERFVPYEAFMGLPTITVSSCTRCSRCVTACPTSALALVPEGIELSVSRCLFCGACADICPRCIAMGREFELASRSREGLRVVYGHG